jgi:hypothetical protein
MATRIIPFNMKDDLLSESMDGKRRYKMINNSDGTVSFEDVTDYDQVGSDFGASEINGIIKNTQGFSSGTTVFNEDGSITETDDLGNKKITTFNSDGSISEKLYKSDVLLATKTTSFLEDGSIKEEIKEG